MDNFLPRYFELWRRNPSRDRTQGTLHRRVEHSQASFPDLTIYKKRKEFPSDATAKFQLGNRFVFKSSENQVQASSYVIKLKDLYRIKHF